MNAIYMPLLYLSSISGAVMVIGGIVMLYKQIISIDRDTRRISVKTPMGTFSTNVPALMLFLLGFIPLIIPIWQHSRLDAPLRITGTVRSDRFPVHVYAATETDTIRGESKFNLRVPKVNGGYQVLYIAGEEIVGVHVDPNLRGSVVELPEVRINAKGGATGLPCPGGPE